MKLSELVKIVAKRTGYPWHEASVICDELVTAIVEVLDRGEDISIRKIGALKWRNMVGNKYIDPRTGKEIHYPPGKKLRYVPSHLFTKRRIEKKNERKVRIRIQRRKG